MANDRMYLSCTCGKATIIAKLWSIGWETRQGLDTSIDTFLQEHRFCGKEEKSFLIEYETGPITSRCARCKGTGEVLGFEVLIPCPNCKCEKGIPNAN